MGSSKRNNNTYIRMCSTSGDILSFFSGGIASVDTNHSLQLIHRPSPFLLCFALFVLFVLFGVASPSFTSF